MEAGGIPPAEDTGLVFSLTRNGDTCNKMPFIMPFSPPHCSQFSLTAYTTSTLPCPTSDSSCRGPEVTSSCSTLDSWASCWSCCSVCPLYTGFSSSCLKTTGSWWGSRSCATLISAGATYQRHSVYTFQILELPPLVNLLRSPTARHSSFFFPTTALLFFPD